jgi:hypothetical protein
MSTRARLRTRVSHLIILRSTLTLSSHIHLALTSVAIHSDAHTTAVNVVILHLLCERDCAVINNLLSSSFSILPVYTQRWGIQMYERTYTGLFFRKVAYTRYEVTWFVEQVGCNILQSSARNNPMFDLVLNIQLCNERCFVTWLTQ